MDWTFYVVCWAILAASVAGLAGYRAWMASHEDDTIHLSGDGSAIAKQKSAFHKLALVDRVGKVLTALAIASGIIILAWYSYLVWQGRLTPIY